MGGYDNGFRFDLIGLHDETKPDGTMEDGTPIQDGTTYYVVDTMDLYVWYKGEWYLQAPSDSEETSNDNEE